MKLADFDYQLPKELIAQHPLTERDSCRLLVLDRAKGTVEHCAFKDIGNYLKPNDLLVLNDTKVLPSRLFGKRPTGGKVEVLLIKEKAPLVFEAMIQPGRVKLGEKINFNAGSVIGTITAHREITFNTKNTGEIYKLGVMPLPPYIKRQAQDSDNIFYQTVYAKNEGAIASPTAGLHFTAELMKKLEAGGVKTAYVTLHVGPGTFKPVSSEDITLHKMDTEAFNVPDEAVDLIQEAKKNKSRVIAVGTTSLRTLEAYASGEKSGQTDLFIYPGYKFKLANCLLTNFHLPRTTLFMLVCAFAGEELAKAAYAQAIQEKYRFYSYGDAMLIL